MKEHLFSRRRAFTLVEMIGVMVIIVVLVSLIGPALTSLQTSNGFTAAVAGIASTLEQSRAYAMGTNTYVYVGIGEYVASESSSVSPRTAGVGQVAVAVVAARDGTQLQSGWSTSYSNGTLLLAPDKLHLYDNVHIADFSATAPPASGKMNRPTVLPAYNLGNSAFVPSTGAPWPFSWGLGKALGSGQYNFTSVIQIDPQGVTRSIPNTLTAYLEIDLQPTHGTLAPPIPTNQNMGNQAAVVIDCMTGAVRTYRP